MNAKTWNENEKAFMCLVGHAFRQQRRRAGLNQTVVAECVGVSQPYWHEVESGEANISLIQFVRACRAIHNAGELMYVGHLLAAVAGEGISS